MEGTGFELYMKRLLEVSASAAEGLRMKQTQSLVGE